MHRIICLCLACFATATAQEIPGHVQFRVLPQTTLPGTHGEVPAFPRVVANAAISPAVADKLNQRLALIDKAQQKNWQECHEGQKPADAYGDWAETADVFMRGPRFVSFHVSTFVTCNAHPNQISEQGLVFDTTTGAPVDWTKLLPGATIGYPSDDPAMQSDIKWAPLTHQVLRLLDPGCRQAVRTADKRFSLWLNGDKGTLNAWLTSLSDADVGPCGGAITLTIADLKRAGASKLLTDALTTALHDPSPLAVKRRADAKKQ